MDTVGQNQTKLQLFFNFSSLDKEIEYQDSLLLDILAPFGS